jgi:hypothetical protein
VKFLSNQKLTTKPAHLHLSFGTFHIKFLFNHFTSLAYEIFYARKVELFDKIKEVVFSQLFRVCVNFNKILDLIVFEKVVCLILVFENSRKILEKFTLLFFE